MADSTQLGLETIIKKSDGSAKPVKVYFEKETINGDDFDATDDDGEGFHCGLPEEETG